MAHLSGGKITGQVVRAIGLTRQRQALKDKWDGTEAVLPMKGHLEGERCLRVRPGPTRDRVSSRSGSTARS
jgi:hypothetical protein